MLLQIVHALLLLLRAHEFAKIKILKQYVHKAIAFTARYRSALPAPPRFGWPDKRSTPLFVTT